MTPLDAALLIGAGAAAGIMNALAGGGTLVTFPALLSLDLSAKIANATSTIALVPGAASSVAGYWSEARSHRAWLPLLLVPSLLGGAAGSLLLLITPERLFAAIAPLLVLFATVLFALQGRAARARTATAGDDPLAAPPLPPPARRAASTAAQFGVAVYGGYFGAGIGILMLTLLGALGLRNIHAMNGLKNVFGIAINGTAAAIFLASGSVHLPSALLLVAGAVPGGFAGARLGRRVGQRIARHLVVAVGLIVTAILALQWI